MNFESRIKTYDIEGIPFYYVEDNPTLFVRMSGGYDSAVLMYVLAYLKQQKLIDSKTVLQAQTANNWYRPYQQKFTNQTIDWINTQFNGDFEPIPHTLIDFPADSNDDLNDALDRLSEKINYLDYDKIYYTAETKFLPSDFTNGTQWENKLVPTQKNYNREVITYKELLNPELPYNPFHHEDELTRLWTATPKEIFKHGSIRPWINHHKAHIKQISDYFGVTDQILKLTRSCEYELFDGTPWMDWSEHCGECLWCAERLVTFGKLQ